MRVCGSILVGDGLAVMQGFGNAKTVKKHIDGLGVRESELR